MAHAIVHRLLDWYQREARDLPWRRTSDAYAIWVAEVMLQQTQVKTVIPYWERWMKALPDPPALAAAREADVLKLWEGLGYYRRVRHLQAGARLIMDRHSGRFPAEWSAILDLPGVGPYTAGAIASIAFNQARPILDGNVIRVLTRLEAVPGDPTKSEVKARLWAMSRILIQAAPETRRRRACAKLNQALMELGALVCAPREPRCLTCPVNDLCEAFRVGEVGRFPETPRRAAPEPRYFVVIVAVHAGRYAVRQRSNVEVNGGLWEFPCLECGTAEESPEAVAEFLWGRGAEGGLALTPLTVVRHAITRYRITQRAFRLDLGTRRADGAGGHPWAWLTLPELDALPFTSAHRRILDCLRTGQPGGVAGGGRPSRTSSNRGKGLHPD